MTVTQGAIARGAGYAAGAFACLVWLCAGHGQAASLEEVKPYLRSMKGADGTTSLEVAVRRLAPERGDGPALWLVGVTHLGTAEYYAEIQRFLDRCSVVLFEAVQADEEGTPGGREDYSLQGDLADALGLVFQLDAIDYDRPHFRNSDLHLDQIARILGGQTNEVQGPVTAGGPAAGAVEFGALVQAMRGEGLIGGVVRLGVSLLRSSSRLQAATKVAMIEVLSDLPNDLTGVPGLPAGMQRLLRVLIEERNEAVVRDVREAILVRGASETVAIFYGAGHMADLEFRLCEQVGYRPAEDRWLTAFEVNPRAMGVSDFEVALTTRLVKAQLKGLERAGSADSPDAPAPLPEAEPAKPR